MTIQPPTPPGPHLVPLPDQLRQLDPAPEPRVLAIVDAEHARWRALHDRLVALIVELLDLAVEDRAVNDVIQRLIGETTISIDDLVGSRVDPVEIAALLRAHGSVGEVDITPEATTFVHQCGSGGRYWLENPQVATVSGGEVPGVPPAVPRYCARCIASIDAHAHGAWTVTPPDQPHHRCTWTVLTPAASRSSDEAP